MKRLAALIVILGSVLGFSLAAAAPAAHAATIAPAAASSGYGGSWAGNAALNWAEGNASGCWYYYGGTGCSPGYDCSGLVMEAVGHATGIWLPRTTYGMLGSSRLHWIPLSQARRGDLLFYGSGHVEFATIWYHQSFGAHSWGQRVGYITWGWGWAPTAAYRIY